jgi:hypothetical protein
MMKKRKNLKELFLLLKGIVILLKNVVVPFAGIQENILTKRQCRKNVLEDMPTIPMNACKDRYLYMIRARNAKLGIYYKSIQGFKISRHKFQLNFVDIEDHWDTGVPDSMWDMTSPRGTAKPIVEIGPVDDLPDDELLIFLNKKNISFFGRENPMRKA